MADGTRMQQRRGTEAQWVTSEYVLADGEIGVSTDTNTAKIGNGVSAWTDLPVLFETEFLPLHATADNAAALAGVAASNYVKFTDTDTAATANKVVERTSTGTVKGATAAASDDLVQKAQLDAAALRLVSRTVTANTTLALSDQSQQVFVNHSSLTAQVVVTVPPNSSVAYPVGAQIDVVAIGAGGAKISPGSGVTINGSTNAFPGYGCVRLIKTATDTWYGLSINSGKRLAKIRALRTGSVSTYGTSYACIPWNSIDSTVDFYNPDNEWFSVPGTGLSTARRIIVNKDGEYLVETNLITDYTSTVWGNLLIAKMTADNTLTGARYLHSVPIFDVAGSSIRARFAAGESVGVWYKAPEASTSDKADGTNNYRCDFTITRLSD